MQTITYPSSVKSQADKLVQSIETREQEITAAIDKIGTSKKLKEKNKKAGISTKYICLHPYQSNISPSKTLLAPIALQIAADNIVNSPEVSHLNSGIALVVTGRDATNFASNIKKIASVINHPAWVQLATLANEESILTINKMQIPKTKPGPYWLNGNIGFITPIITTEQLINSAEAQQITPEINLTPTERLINAATRQKNLLAKQKGQLSQLNNQYTGQCYALKLSGTQSAIRKQLLDFQTDNQPYSSVLVILTNDSENLSLLYEMFSL
ncbi:hypothetical protein [Aliivibrio fischeri]|uniref:Uncharacterized protein n=1 Tax=Aliivibrio fischeri TaxID=668 RepID=A0A510UIN2_ALIFS|nr:hypothetical protein [Aliivibrio fischeri]GEK13210.1 hypothetical protein AFI02nite_12460 [Aliivibrio fischeri]